MADLMRRIEVPCEVDFMAISSYGAGVDSSGVVRILKDLDISIEGRNVLVVEDIIDSGLTLSYLLRNLEAREPASLEICALLTKPVAPRDRHPLPLHRLRDPEQVRDRLRPRLRRAVPKPPVRGRSQGGIGGPGRRVRPNVKAHPYGVGSRIADCYASSNSEVSALSRFFRSALFPLIVIVLLVYLASQTFLPRSEDQPKVTYSQLKQGGRDQPRGHQGDPLQPEGPLDRGDVQERGEVEGQLPQRPVADRVREPARPRRARPSPTTRRARARTAGGRSSRTCFRSSSSSRSGSSS